MEYHIFFHAPDREFIMTETNANAPSAEDTILLTRRNIMILSTLAGGISAVSPAMAMQSLGNIMKVGKDVVQSETLSDADLKAYCDQMTKEEDRLNPVAGPKDPYGKRLAMLSKGLATHDGLALDIKAYKVVDVNAFAMANGTIRVFAGLMDKFTDDEIRYVIGHEIGHVKNGHSKKRMQTALRTKAAKGAVGSAGGTIGQLANSELGDLFAKVISAQHSQGNEKEADDYAMAFMKAKGWPGMAAVTALDKLAAMEGGSGKSNWMATHPSPAARAKRMRTALGG
jgi:putative metalloprotease